MDQSKKHRICIIYSSPISGRKRPGPFTRWLSCSHPRVQAELDTLPWTSVPGSALSRCPQSPPHARGWTKLPSQVPVGDGSPPASQGGSMHWLYSWASEAGDLGANSASTAYSQVTLGCGFTSLRLCSQLVKQNPTLFTASTLALGPGP